MGGFVDCLVEALAFGFILETSDPHVKGCVVLTCETAEYDHALRDLEGNDFIFHKAHPALLMSIPDFVLAEFEKHCDPRCNCWPIKIIATQPLKVLILGDPLSITQIFAIYTVDFQKSAEKGLLMR